MAIFLDFIAVIIVIVILTAMVWILLFKNKKIRIQLNSEKKKYDYYKSELSNLQSSKDNAEKLFKRLNKLTRDFFKQYLGFKYNLTYLELSKKFKKQGKVNYADFCILMSKLDYSGEIIAKEKLNEAMNSFNDILANK